MKKVFLPLIAAVALSASAAVPTTFNYQGVCNEKSSTVSVTFQVVADDGNTVYQETKEVETSPNGAFTAVVGDDTNADWTAINWGEGGYTVKTFIGGVNVSTAELHAVPYANVAASVDGITAEALDVLFTDVNNLVMANRETKTDIETLKLQAENHDMTGAVAQTAYDMADANADAIAIISSDLQGVVESMRGKANVEDVVALQDGVDVLSTDVNNLVLANRENKTDIAELKDALANMEENNDMSVELINSILESIASLEEAMAYVSGDTQGITELLRGKANVEDVVALQDGVDVLSTDVNNLVLANRENKTDIAELKGEVDKLWNAAENADMTGTVAQEAYDKVLDLEDVVANATSDIQGLTETMRGKASVEDVAALRAEFDAVVENMDMSIPVMEQMYENVEALLEGADVLSNDVAGLVAANRENKTDIAELKAALANMEENNDMSVQLINTMLENIEALQAGADVLSTDVNGLVLANRENKTDIAELKAALANMEENNDMSVELINTMLENIEALQAGADVLSTDVNNLVAANRENKTDIAELRLDVNTALEHANKAGEIAAANYEDLFDLHQVVDNATSDIQGLTETMRGKADVAEVAKISESLNTAYEMIEALKSENASLLHRVMDLESAFAELSASGN